MSLWLLLTPLLPLTLASLLFIAREHARFCVWGVRLAPLALLPALIAGLLLPAGTTLELDAVLLGMRLGLDETGRVFLLFSATLWLLGTLYAQQWLAGDPQRARCFGFMLAAAAGNLGLCIAQDVLSFYWLFALMTFGAWPLVLHRATPAARHAGTVYLVLAVLGETALLLALLPIAAAGGMLIADVPAIVAASPWRDALMALLLIGFGAKIGVLGLHVVLPLAYAATPVPGAAVLASAMIKAGLLGWLRFLPLGHALPDWGAVFVVLGLAAAFYGVAIGLAQRAPKAILAYSSVSQMGLMTAGVGLGLTVPEAGAAALFALTLYALHHALAKAALFLGEGLARATAGPARRWVLAGLTLPALAIAGAPLTGGALAKHYLKDLAPFAPWPELFTTLLTLASVGTTLLMARFLWQVRQSRNDVDGARTLGLAVPWLMLLAVMLAGVWLLPPDRAALLTPAAMSAAALPLALGALLALVGGWLLRGRNVALPSGDVLGPIEAAGRWLWDRLPVAANALTALRMKTREPWHDCCADWRAALPAASLETWLRTGRGAGLTSLAIALFLVALFALAD